MKKRYNMQQYFGIQKGGYYVHGRSKRISQLSTDTW